MLSNKPDLGVQRPPDDADGTVPRFQPHEMRHDLEETLGGLLGLEQPPRAHTSELMAQSLQTSAKAPTTVLPQHTEAKNGFPAEIHTHSNVMEKKLSPGPASAAPTTPPPPHGAKPTGPPAPPNATTEQDDVQSLNELLCTGEAPLTKADVQRATPAQVTWTRLLNSSFASRDAIKEFLSHAAAGCGSIRISTSGRNARGILKRCRLRCSCKCKCGFVVMAHFKEDLNAWQLVSTSKEHVRPPRCHVLRKQVTSTYLLSSEDRTWLVEHLKQGIHPTEMVSLFERERGRAIKRRVIETLRRSKRYRDELSAKMPYGARLRKKLKRQQATDEYIASNEAMNSAPPLGTILSAVNHALTQSTPPATHNRDTSLPPPQHAPPPPSQGVVVQRFLPTASNDAPYQHNTAS